jgi:polysaccharide biosynthesis/export protein
VRPTRSLVLGLLGLFAAVVSGGCATITPPRGDKIVPPEVPVELNKITHPEYVIEAPDILQIDAIQAVPRQPYTIHPFDTLSVAVMNTIAGQPIAGFYVVDQEGMLNLGPTYFSVKVAGLSVEEAQKALETHLASPKVGLVKPMASITVTQSHGVQQISGEHLVRADGTIYLGTYGSIRVTGLTLTQAKKAIEQHLTAYLNLPEITLDVVAYNSKLIYVIFDGGGVGQALYRLPVTGNETVLDAITQVNGLGPVSDQNHIWVARPAPPKGGCDQILPVDWVGITEKGQTATNYQLMPGDRVFVKAYHLTTFDTVLARVISPVERVFGILLLGTNTVSQIHFFDSFGSNGGVGGSTAR